MRSNPLRRHTLAARTLLGVPAIRGAPGIPGRVLTTKGAAAVADLYRMAAGHLLRVCDITGEDSGQVARRLRLNPAVMGRLRATRGRAVAALAAVNRPDRTPACVLGVACECTSLRQKARCGNWRKGDPSAYDRVGLPGLDAALAVVDNFRGWRPGDLSNEPDPEP